MASIHKDFDLKSLFKNLFHLQKQCEAMSKLNSSLRSSLSGIEEGLRIHHDENVLRLLDDVLLEHDLKQKGNQILVSKLKEMIQRLHFIIKEKSISPDCLFSELEVVFYLMEKGFRQSRNPSTAYRFSPLSHNTSEEDGSWTSGLSEQSFSLDDFSKSSAPPQVSPTRTASPHFPLSPALYVSPTRPYIKPSLSPPPHMSPCTTRTGNPSIAAHPLSPPARTGGSSIVLPLSPPRTGSSITMSSSRPVSTSTCMVSYPVSPPPPTSSSVSPTPPMGPPVSPPPLVSSSMSPPQLFRTPHHSRRKGTIAEKVPEVGDTFQVGRQPNALNSRMTSLIGKSRNEKGEKSDNPVLQSIQSRTSDLFSPSLSCPLPLDDSQGSPLALSSTASSPSPQQTMKPTSGSHSPLSPSAQTSPPPIMPSPTPASRFRPGDSTPSPNSFSTSSRSKNESPRHVTPKRDLKKTKMFSFNSKTKVSAKESQEIAQTRKSRNRSQTQLAPQTNDLTRSEPSKQQKERANKTRSTRFKKKDHRQNEALPILEEMSAGDSPKVVLPDEVSLDEIVESLTDEKNCDLDSRNRFFLTYLHFTDTKEVLRILISRFINTSDCSDENLSVRRLRVIAIVKHMITFLPNDIEDPETQDILFALFDEHFTTVIEYNSKGNGEKLRHSFTNRHTSQRAVRIANVHDPNPELANASKLQWNQIVPSEFALALSFYESYLFCQVESNELLHWTKKDKHTTCPNISKIATFSTRLSEWVTSELVQRTRVTDRVALLQRYISLVEHLLELNNFSSCMSILAGISNSAFWRMKKTWESLDKDLKKQFESLQQIMSPNSNFRTYRAFLKRAELPCVPYVGVYLTDITFIEDGNRSYVNGFINFKKWTMISELLENLTQFQTPFSEKHQTPEWDFGSSFEQVTILCEDERYKLSNLMEPKDQEAAMENLLKLYQESQHEIAELKRRYEDHSEETTSGN